MTKYSPDSNSERPLPLKKTVRQIVESLANISLAKAPSDPDQPPSGDQISQDFIRGVIWAWQSRVDYLPPELLSDPAWVMLLELLQGELAGNRVSMSRVCQASGVPDSTAIRWLKALGQHDLVIRRSDPDDAGDEIVELTSKGSAALRRYFRDVLNAG